MEKSKAIELAKPFLKDKSIVYVANDGKVFNHRTLANRYKEIDNVDFIEVSKDDLVKEVEVNASTSEPKTKRKSKKT